MLKKTLILGMVLSVCGSFLSLHASDYEELQKIVASDREASDYFGASVSISGDHAIVGAYYENEDADGLNTLLDAGSAYIFKKNIDGTWTQMKKVVASDRGENDNFGASVSISDDHAIVGAYWEDEDAAGENTLSSAGSAYIFKNIDGTWTQMQKIVASDREASDYFGKSVSISGDHAIVGAYLEDEDADGLNTLLEAGSAYIFKNIDGTWTQMKKIVASDRGENDNFGASVSISGDHAIAGARCEDEDAAVGNTLSSAGSAYIFKKIDGTWTQMKKVVASDRGENDNFGASVSISDDHAIVGAYWEDEDAAGENTLLEAGSAYVFSIPVPDYPLPIELSSFNGEILNGYAMLSWVTASETENAAFRIYRNGELLAELEGAGTTSEPQYYQYTDNHVIPGKTYTYVLADVTIGNKEVKHNDKAVTITAGEGNVGKDYSIGVSHPNPFNPTCMIPLNLAVNAEVHAVLYDLNGRLVNELHNGALSAGSHDLQIDGANLATGIYLVKIQINDMMHVQKIAFIK